MSMEECQPIECVSCERWLDINSYPSTWNAYNNVCGDKECEEKFNHDLLWKEITNWSFNGSWKAAGKTLEKVKTAAVSQEQRLDLVDYGKECCVSWSYDTDEVDRVMWLSTAIEWERYEKSIKKTDATV